MAIFARKIWKKGSIRWFVDMILVMVGTHNQPFDRLIKAVDDLVAKHTIKGEVLIQVGYSKTVPKYAKWFKFVDYDKMMELMRESKIIITHAGIGSTLLSIRMRKPTIVVPRLKKLNEHTDNHQIEITKELAKQNKIIPVYNISTLKDAIKTARRFKPKIEPKLCIIEGTVKSFLDSLRPGV